MKKKNQQKLELTWIGKGNEPKLEPRILIEDTDKSYGDPDSKNMLIHGDNLLALKALEQEYTGKVKCIYIDPPYNTGNAFEHYDDNLEHSIWLNLIYQRIKILFNLLSPDGAFCLHLDDQEVHYAKIVCDEIFGRKNFIATVAIKSSTPSGVKTKHKDKKIIKQKDLILIYKKSDLLRINSQYTRKDKWDTHFNYYINDDKKTVSSFVKILKDRKILTKNQSIKDFDMGNSIHRKFYMANSHRICQTQSHKNKELKEKSRKLKDEILYHGEVMFYNGRQLTPLENSMHNVLYKGNVEKDIALLLCDFWFDVDFQNTQNEGAIAFPNSKKPEALIYRIISLFSDEKDIILDSFLGSGTTAAVAHKMNRQWIGLELGNHAVSHCLPRLRNVTDGIDQSGISRAVGWQGGGGFKFYRLAPSLLNQDSREQWVISKEYNPEMLAAAVAKQEGFTYHPDDRLYWKQGNSTEQDYIFITTQPVTVELLASIKEEMKENESLLVCCTSFQKECNDYSDRITVKKIPQMLLGRCEFGQEDYSLNIVNLPLERPTLEEEEHTMQKTTTHTNAEEEEDPPQLSMF